MNTTQSASVHHTLRKLQMLPCIYFLQLLLTSSLYFLDSKHRWISEVLVYYVACASSPDNTADRLDCGRLSHVLTAVS